MKVKEQLADTCDKLEKAFRKSSKHLQQLSKSSKTLSATCEKLAETFAKFQKDLR